MDTNKTAPANSKPFQKKKRNSPKPPKRITADYLHNSGLYYLQRYASSSQNFRRVMDRKIRKSCNFHTDQNYEDCVKLLDTLVSRFLENGLLNDENYGYGMVTSFRRRGLSKTQIIQKLRIKGIQTDDIQGFLNRYDEEHDLNSERTEYLSAIKFCKKRRLGPFATTNKEPDKQKDIAKFARAGFGFDLAHKVLEMDLETAEDELFKSL